MALVPRIDSPCPLGIDEQRRLSGYCGHCERQVHALDALDDAQRRALLDAADGKICVSYRRPAPAARRGVGFGIATAATLVSGGAFAADPPALPVATEANASPVLPADPLLPAERNGEECEPSALERITLVGGVNDPRDAQWIDDSDLPELPQRDANTLADALAMVPAAPESQR